MLLCRSEIIKKYHCIGLLWRLKEIVSTSLRICHFVTLSYSCTYILIKSLKEHHDMFSFLPILLFLFYWGLSKRPISDIFMFKEIFKHYKHILFAQCPYSSVEQLSCFVSHVFQVVFVNHRDLPIGHSDLSRVWNRWSKIDQ